jgi:uncharacterized protein YdhG (YjbR/CyaY superfamily)
MHFKSHDEYIAAQPAELRARLVQVQQAVESQLPQAQRTVGYNMPAFRLGRIFFYFAAFKNHIGVYPPVTGDAELIELTAAYRGPKGNLSFPHTEDLPLQLIARVACALAAQYRAP